MLKDSVYGVEERKTLQIWTFLVIRAARKLSSSDGPHP